MKMIAWKFFLCFLTASVLKSSHIKSIIYFIFLKNVLNQTWRSFNIKLQSQWKDRKSSYIVRQILALFCNLIALILEWHCVKGLRVNKIVKKIKFEGIWGELAVKKCFQRQSFTKYLRLTIVFMWNSALRKNSSIRISRVFY